MKSFRILWALIAGSILFAVGLLIPPAHPIIRDVFITSGVLSVLFFYIMTLWDVIHSSTLSEYIRIFWLVVVVCVPVIGNLAYVIIHYTVIKKQVPHGIW
jgi:hypothetical protein